MARQLDTSIDREYVSGFLFPSLACLPSGYDFTCLDPTGRLVDRLVVPDCDVVFGFRVFFDGSMEHESSWVVKYRDYAPVSPDYKPFVWKDPVDRWKGGAGIFEYTVEEVNRRPAFKPRFPLGMYTIYTKEGKKSFFSDGAAKYGVPRSIDMVARFGKFVDGHPLIHIDRKRDLGESIILVNPYSRPLVAEILFSDGRKIKKTRIDPLSTRQFSLIDVLGSDEDEWIGQIQVTANNRVVVFSVKHSLEDPMIISDFEHLDPFRADPTGLPATQLMRQKVGAAVGLG